MPRSKPKSILETKTVSYCDGAGVSENFKSLQATVKYNILEVMQVKEYRKKTCFVQDLSKAEMSHLCFETQQLLSTAVFSILHTIIFSPYIFEQSSAIVYYLSHLDMPF